jgi:quercetin dioxygenase-like cupin family protein
MCGWLDVRSDMERPVIGPYALNRGEGRTYSFGPEFIIKAGELGPGRRLAFVDYTTRIGEEPGDHTHPTEDEIFYVVHGAVTFRCEDKTFDVEDGGFVFLPRGLRHGYTIRSSGEVRMLVVTSPADENASGGWGGLIGDLEREAQDSAG